MRIARAADRCEELGCLLYQLGSMQHVRLDHWRSEQLTDTLLGHPELRGHHGHLYSLGGDMDVKGVQGECGFDGEWITITKRAVGQSPRTVRIRAADVTGTRHKAGTRLFHGYVQFLVPGSTPAEESTSLLTGGRPPQDDPHSLSIPRRSNEAAVKLLAAVEQARG
ncbi:DUF4429 domain-containing protein [Streptomyces sp. NPDC057677]|uniref:DUF4429 domain-containing protein n=1 Tax=unclassified Streptomyces TaxID=2593676 RepID=UPI003677EA2C